MLIKNSTFHLCIQLVCLLLSVSFYTLPKHFAPSEPNLLSFRSSCWRQDLFLSDDDSNANPSAPMSHLTRYR